MVAKELHRQILNQIKQHSGQATQHTFLDSYLGNAHPRYPINAPTLRKLAKSWMQDHADLTGKEFCDVATCLIEAPSSTEKCMAGILLDYAKQEQRNFPPQIFDHWLDHLIGWAEVDSVCTGKYTVHEIPRQWKIWKPMLKKFSISENIQKRRASLVLLCSVVRHCPDENIATLAFENIDRLKSEKNILITKAISWLLRSMIKHQKKRVHEFVELNKSELPAIAVRETLTVLKTGKKTAGKK